jgi:hypothetical protein
MRYLVHIFAITPSENLKEISSIMDTYILENLDDVMDKLVLYFDDLNITDFPETYKEFEDEYIQKCMDCQPIRFTVFDLERKLFIHTIKITDVYKKFLENIMMEEMAESVETKMII